jgi:large subunit ribosomal protein L11
MASPKMKAVIKTFRLQLPAGKATPAPPVGPALSQHGLNIMEFVNQFTAKMEDDMIIPVDIMVHADKTFTLKMKTPPASYFLKKAAGVLKGSGEPNKNKVGKVTRKQVEDIAKAKLEDLNTQDLQQAIKIIEGSARSLGLEIK